MNDNKSVLIIGNGFDIALKRKTSYKDFYESKYCPKWYSAPLIAYLNGWTDKNELDDIKWMDMETAIQDYAKERGKNSPLPFVPYTDEEFALVKKIFEYEGTPVPHRKYEFSEDEIELLKQMKNKNKIEYEKTYAGNWYFPKIKDIYKFYMDQNSIKNYYKDEASSSGQLEQLSLYAEQDRNALKEIEDKLAQYLNEKVDCSTLDSENNLAYALLKRFWQNYPNGVIYSFNYTSLESLIEKIEEEPISKSILSKRIKYMHGSLEKEHVIIGAGIKKTNNEYGEWDFLMKTRDNQYLPPALMKHEMENAEIVFVYGLSFGEIDYQYFERLFNNMLPENKGKDNKEPKTVVLIGRNIERLKNNIKNIDILLTEGVNVISSKNHEYDPSILDDYLPDVSEAYQRRKHSSVF